jgi:hypothetical protein
MVLVRDIQKRSPMYVSIDSRLLGLAITIFILILTIKSEILEDQITIIQLVMAIPLLLGAMISNARIVDMDSFKQYYLFNRMSNAVGTAFVYNTIGLLIGKYVSFSAGLIYFILLSAVLMLLMMTKFNERKLYNEVTMIVIVAVLGFLPLLGIIKLA